MANWRFDEITAALASELPPSRFRHTLGVLHAATVIAERQGADVERIQLAAILHDCAKPMGREELTDYIRNHGLSVDEADFSYPAILHGPVGADIARRRFGADDAEVLDAIEFHPAGRIDPSVTLQILMAADYCEPTRDFEGVEEARSAVRLDLRSGLASIVRNKINGLTAAGRVAHPRASQMIASLEGC